jgi:hypothetical protein
MTHLCDAKMARVSSPPTPQLKNLEKQLCDEIKQLTSASDRTQLNAQVLAFMRSRNPQEAAAAKTRLLSTHLQLSATHHGESRRQHATLQTIAESIKAHIQLSIETCAQNYATHQRSLQEHFTQVSTQARELETWAQRQNGPAIFNITPFDMKWVIEMIKNMAYDRAKSKVDQLFNALYQRHNYIGFVNQVILLPFLEK